MTQTEEQKSAQRLFVRAAATNDQQAEACLAGRHRLISQNATRSINFVLGTACKAHRHGVCMCLAMNVTSHCRQYCQHEPGGQLTFLHSALYKRRMPCRRWTRRSAEHSGRYASCYVLSAYTVRELRLSVAGCPVVTSDFNPSNLMPQSSNQPTPGQSQPLGRQRVPSTIPVGMHVQPACCNFAFLARPNLLFVAIAAVFTV